MKDPEAVLTRAVKITPSQLWFGREVVNGLHGQPGAGPTDTSLLQSYNNSSEYTDSIASAANRYAALASGRQ